MSSALDQPASVSYGITGGTAAGGGVDYSLPGDTLTFAPGETIRTINLAVVKDTTAEPDKTVVVSLLGASNAVLGANTSYTYTIRGELGQPLPGTEGSPLVQFEVAASRGSESGTSLKRVAVTLTHAAAGKVTVAYSVAGGTASEADYTFTPGVLNFYPGETRKTFSFSLANDTISEAAETVVFSLSKVSSNAKLGAPSQYTYTIADDDGLPRVQFEMAASGGPESYISPAPITVTLTNPSAATVTVDYAVTGGTAAATDYSFAPGTLVFNPGEIRKTFMFSVVDDTICEPDETIIFSLSNVSSSALPGTQSDYTYTIIADDPVPTAQFVSAASNNPESVPQVDVPVRLSDPSATAVAVTYLATRNTTTVGVVDVVGSGTVTFAPGEILKNIVFPVVVETTPEANETVYISLTDASGAVLGAITTHTYYFVDGL